MLLVQSSIHLKHCDVSKHYYETIYFLQGKFYQPKSYPLRMCLFKAILDVTIRFNIYFTMHRFLEEKLDKLGKGPRFYFIFQTAFLNIWSYSGKVRMLNLSVRH